MTEINGIKGYLDLNCRFYPVDVLKDAYDRFEKEYPELAAKAGGFGPSLGCSTQPNPSFSLRYFR